MDNDLYKKESVSGENRNHSHDIRLAAFSNDPQAAFVFKKTEKLVTALYMITNFFSDNEPLKWSVRELSVDLLSDITNLSSKFLQNRSHVFNAILEKSFNAVSLLHVSLHAGLISEMNFNIIKNEFEALIVLLQEQEKKPSENKMVMFAENFFNTNTDVVDNNQKPNIVFAKDTNKGQLFQEGFISSKVSPSRNIQKPFQSQAPAKAVKDNLLSGGVKVDRKGLILGLLKKRNNLTIKDFASVISDCSEKTIQRELLDLVAKNVLKKEGERRWSRYSLAA